MAEIAEILNGVKADLKQGFTNPRLTLDIPVSDMESLITAAYAAELCDRHQVAEISQASARHIKAAAKWLTDAKYKPSLLLFGSVGNGKTTLAHAITDATDALRDKCKDAYQWDLEAKRKEYVDKHGYDYRAVGNIQGDETLRNLSRFPRATVTTAQKLADLASGDDVEKRKFADAKRCPLLVVDDLGCEPAAVKHYGTEITPITDVIYYRYEMLVPTIFTTNLGLAEIESVYGSRVKDRILEMCETISFNEKSYRK